MLAEEMSGKARAGRRSLRARVAGLRGREGCGGTGGKVGRGAKGKGSGLILTSLTPGRVRRREEGPEEDSGLEEGKKISPAAAGGLARTWA